MDCLQKYEYQYNVDKQTTLNYSPINISNENQYMKMIFFPIKKPNSQIIFRTSLNNSALRTSLSEQVPPVSCPNSSTFRNINVESNIRHGGVDNNSLNSPKYSVFRLNGEGSDKFREPVLKHSNKKNKKVNFETNCNKIILIHGLSFYNENNIKKDIWWSILELNTMRKMVTNEIIRMQRLNPKLSASDCIRTLC
jgi:hypothetical protein